MKDSQPDDEIIKRVYEDDATVIAAGWYEKKTTKTKTMTSETIRNLHGAPITIYNCGGSRYIADASELGLPPGSWPMEISVALPGRSAPILLRRGAELNGVEGFAYEAGQTRLEVVND